MFGMTGEIARTIAAEAGTAVGRWCNAAARHGLTPNEAERMPGAFDHEDPNAATRSKTAWHGSRRSAWIAGMFGNRHLAGDTRAWTYD